MVYIPITKRNLGVIVKYPARNHRLSLDQRLQAAVLAFYGPFPNTYRPIPVPIDLSPLPTKQKQSHW
jgi:hypothetical protein